MIGREEYGKEKELLMELYGKELLIVELKKGLNSFSWLRKPPSKHLEFQGHS